MNCTPSKMSEGLRACDLGCAPTGEGVWGDAALQRCDSGANAPTRFKHCGSHWAPKRELPLGGAALQRCDSGTHTDRLQPL